MSRPEFAHLHTASGYSLRYGASTPRALAGRAAELGQTALALTDRDGLYGAVRFALACREFGLSPILGVDLGVAPSGLLERRSAVGRRRTTPARGGAWVDAHEPRVVFLARGRQGWSSLCRLVSAAHLSGERGRPVVTLEQVAENSAGLVALLGPQSELAGALTARRPDLARMIMNRWAEIFAVRSSPAHSQLFIEVVNHFVPDGPGVTGQVRGAPWVANMSVANAAASFRWGAENRIPVILSNAVRHTTPQGARTVDVLDAIRRLVPLSERHLDRGNAEGYLKSTAAMQVVAEQVLSAAGSDRRVQAWLADVAELADSCSLEPVRDLGLGSIHVPELDVVMSGRSGAPGDPDTTRSAAQILASRCEDELRRYRGARLRDARQRLTEELETINQLGFAGYFLTVSEVVDLTRDLGIRVAARGSGAGSLVNHLLGISGVDPLRHGLIMERFLSPLRHSLPDIDIDVESHRRTELYEHILERFGGERCTCVSMMDTYRVRHAVRDVGAALGMPPGEVDGFAKAFPHIRAADARSALEELPELRNSTFGRNAAAGRLDNFLDLVESLDGLPRHVALHPCGVLLSDATLLDRTPVEASWLGFPMSQFDKDDVEEMGFLKLDVLGIRMQSAMSHAVAEIRAATGESVDLDTVPFDDAQTFDLIQDARTLGCFQIESPGQRELVGKFTPESFADLIIDISLFRPGPVKSDMISPFLRARHGWSMPEYLHESLRSVLSETAGVVVFHEQVIKIVAIVAGCSLAQADEVRRTLGSPQGQQQVRGWLYPRAMANGYSLAEVESIWDVLKAFASFGFCKAHAAAFALPTYQSAWLKAHYPAAFFAGVLTHDPGMYPKRLILDDARHEGVVVLGLDVNHSGRTYTVVPELPAQTTGPVVPGVDEDVPQTLDLEHPDRGPWGESRWVRPASGGVSRVAAAELVRAGTVAKPGAAAPQQRHDRAQPVPDHSGTGEAEVQHAETKDQHEADQHRQTGVWGLRLPLAEVKGISEAEQVAIIARRPYLSLPDFWHRSGCSRPVTERLIMAGAFDELHQIGQGSLTGITRRDLLLQVGDLERYSRSLNRGRGNRSAATARPGPAMTGRDVSSQRLDSVAAAHDQSQAPAKVRRPDELSTQLTLELGDAPDRIQPSGLPELTAGERVRAEVEILGMDITAHVVSFYEPMLAELAVVRSEALLACRSNSEILVAGVKVATQTPPVRSGRRVVFLTLDDSTGPVDATFFEDVQGEFATTVFGSWLLLVRGHVRRTGRRGISLRATGAWDLGEIRSLWQESGAIGVYEFLGASAASAPGVGKQFYSSDYGPGSRGGGGMVNRRRVLLHASGFRTSPYADVKPAGSDPKQGPPAPVGQTESSNQKKRSGEQQPPAKLWHSSPGSSGW